MQNNTIITHFSVALRLRTNCLVKVTDILLSILSEKKRGAVIRLKKKILIVNNLNGFVLR